MAEATTGGVLLEKVFLEISLYSQEKTCARASFLIKLPATFLKRRLWHRCFPLNFAKFLRTSSLTEHLRWLLLKWVNPFHARRFLGTETVIQRCSVKRCS